jgi:hypothetical protein
MEPVTILLLAGIGFLLIAVVGGGFEIKEIKIPIVPRWARILSGLLGMIFCGLSVADFPQPPPPPPPRGQFVYEDKNQDTNSHQLKFLTLTAKSKNNPPQVGDQLTVEFTLQNVSDQPIKILGTYVTAYDPSEQNKDFGFSSRNILLLPQEIITTKGSMIVSVPGTWELGPHYAIGENWDIALYPGHWHRFSVHVQ